MVAGSTKDKGQTIVVNYNANYANGSNYSGASYSSDGGATFTEIQPAPFASGHGTNYGDPLVVFNSKLGMFFAGDWRPAAAARASVCGPLPMAKPGRLEPALTTAAQTTGRRCGRTT